MFFRSEHIYRLIAPLLVGLSFAIAPAARSQTPIANPLALTGTWYNPATSGQGFVFDIAPNSDGSAVLFGGWFTYDTPDIFDDQIPLWFTLQGRFQTSQSEITVPIYYNGDLDYLAPPLPKPIEVGSARIQFSDCTHATLDYSFSNTRVFLFSFEPPAGGGTIPLVRLTADTGCGSTAVLPKSSRGFSGTWYNPATTGQGFVFDINPITNDGFFFGGWFYRSPGFGSWYTLQGRFAPTDTEADIPLYCSPGGFFTTTVVAGLSGTTMQCGTTHIKFTSCTTASLSYAFNGSDTPAVTIPLQRLTAVPADCPLR